MKKIRAVRLVYDMICRQIVFDTPNRIMFVVLLPYQRRFRRHRRFEHMWPCQLTTLKTA